MDYGSDTLAALVRALSRLPGIGAKSAQRIALHLLRGPRDEAQALAHLVATIHERVRFCRTCGAITEAEECAICTDPARDRTTVCVVEQPQDVIFLEKTGRYRGLYHVLHGVLSPIDGVGPGDLALDRLAERLRRENVREVIVATNPTVEGDTTALYIARSVAPPDCTVTRLARGLPAGATLEFTDDTTLARAIEGRKAL